MKSYSWSQNQIIVGVSKVNCRVSRVSRVSVRARVSAGVRFKLIILIGPCQIWLLLQWPT